MMLESMWAGASRAPLFNTTSTCRIAALTDDLAAWRALAGHTVFIWTTAPPRPLPWSSRSGADGEADRLSTPGSESPAESPGDSV